MAGVCPHDVPGVPLALCMSLQSPGTRGHSCRETKPTAAERRWGLWARSALKSPLGSTCPLGWGFQFQSPSLKLPQLQMTAALRNAMHVGGWGSVLRWLNSNPWGGMGCLQSLPVVSMLAVAPGWGLGGPGSGLRGEFAETGPRG